MAWFWSNDDGSEHSSDYESYSEEEEESFDDDDDDDAASFEDDSEVNSSSTAAIPINEQLNGNSEETKARETLDGVHPVTNERAMPMATSNAPPGDNDEELDGSLREDEFNLLVGGSETKSVLAHPSTDCSTASHSKNNGVASSEGEVAGTNGADSSGGKEEEAEEAEEEEEQVTTLEEKQSLLVLAAEHDRVDILQAILSAAESEENDDRNTLLNPTESIPPPLHIAVHYGSVNAVNCLLRMGANPSVRPPAVTTQTKAAVEIRDLHRFQGKTAWQLAFEEPDSNGGSFSSLFSGGSTTAPSKREGIRHAFTAEALRCVGADEVNRLQELIDSGLPVDSLVGGKTLIEWTVEMEAEKCRKLIQPDDDVTPRSSAVVRRGDGSTVEALSNRLDELENLSSALATCLDNLAEEVSVCSGLLLVGSGAAALATHVRSLKAQKEKLSTELERLGDAWENTEDELAYWVRECGGVDILSLPTSSSKIAHVEPSAGQTTGSATAEVGDDSAAAEEEASKRKLSGLIAACETKIRMLRASISDLSEENTRNLEAIGQKGLTGAVTLVRKLREEIRDLEFQLSEWKSGEAASRAKIQLLQQHHAKHGKSTVVLSTITESQTPGAESYDDDNNEDADAMTTPSHSTAIIVRPKDGTSGFLPMNIWQLLLRIIGFNNDGGDTGAARPAIIV